jgi:hypothetical protein
LSELQLAAEPLDRVREQQRAREKDGEARRQENHRTHARTLQARRLTFTGFLPKPG